MTDTGPALWEVFAALGFLILVLLVGYYALTRLRLRRKQLSLELDTSKDLVEDRSFNQLRIARAEADLLASRGIDVHRARGLIEEAEAARGRRDYDNSLALARSAHESLVKLHQGLPLSNPPMAGAATRAGGASQLDAALPPSAEPAVPVGARDPPSSLASQGPGGDLNRAPLPRNKAESKFQMSLLDEELARATASSGPNAAVLEATEIKTRAGEAFDKGDFTEAMRLALRGRRRLGTQLETLAPAPSSVGASGDAETSTACRSCGEMLRANDRFCRFCGTLRGTARCASCGTPLEADDKFCASCGRPTADATSS